MLKRFYMLVLAGLAATILAGCGGGSGGGLLGGSSGSVSVKLLNASGSESNQLTTDAPLTAVATVRDVSGNAVSGAVVTFSADSSLASFTPSAATVLTNANGEARIAVSAASAAAAGAGTLKASATIASTSVSGSVSFNVTSTGSGVPKLALSLTDSSGLVSSTLSSSHPLTATAKVLDGTGAGVSGVVVTFATDSTLAALSPVAGTALTDSTGTAKIQVSAASVSAAGAATITASATLVNSTTVQGASSYSVSPGVVVLKDFAIADASIAAYGTTSISVTVNVDGTPTTTPVAVSFSSGCSASGKATLASSVQTVGGVATATYTDKGCSGTDTITVSAQGASSVSGKLIVAAPKAANLQYVSASPATIYLKGTGLVEVSTVTFKVVDSTGTAVSGQSVKFDLDTRTGGILLDGTSGAVTKKSASDGTASVTVTAGTNPTPVFVKAVATLADGSSLTSQSNKLTITTGLPAQDSFSLSIGTHNIEGWDYDGTTTSVNVIASDRLGNPVPDGTVVNFISEGAQISPSSCVTTSGRCSVSFVSAERRPTSDSEPTGVVTKGRVSILAYSLGEESFIDANGNNVYDSGEAFSDLGDVFIDANEDSSWSANEQYVPYGASGACSAPGTKGNYGFALSKAGSCDGKWGRAHVRRQELIVLSSSHAAVSPTSFTGACGTTTYSIWVYDINGNPMPAGTTVSAGTSNVVFTNKSGTEATASVSVVNGTVLDTVAVGGTVHGITVTAKDCTSKPTGNFALNVTSPKGLTTIFNIQIK